MSRYLVSYLRNSALFVDIFKCDLKLSCLYSTLFVTGMTAYKEKKTTNNKSRSPANSCNHVNLTVYRPTNHAFYTSIAVQVAIKIAQWQYYLLLSILHRNFCLRFCRRSEGSWQPNSIWHCLTVSILPVLKSFMKNLFMTKSSELTSDFFRGHISKPYSRIGIHLLYNSCSVTSSGATLPIFPKILLAAR